MCIILCCSSLKMVCILLHYEVQALPMVVHLFGKQLCREAPSATSQCHMAFSYAVLFPSPPEELRLPPKSAEGISQAIISIVDATNSMTNCYFID